MSDPDQPPKIGPTGQFPLGRPGFEGDRGGLYAGFKVVPPHCVWNFGTSSLTHLAVTPTEAKAQAAIFRKAVTEKFGVLSYDKSQLPIRVSLEKDGMIHIHFPWCVGMLVANPHVFLALAERIDEEVAKAPPVS